MSESEGENSDGARCVGADTGQREQLVDVVWNDAAMALDDSDGARVEVEGATRVPESIPRAHRLPGGNRGQVCRCGPPLEPFLESGDDAHDRRLLQHEFAH